MTVFDENPNKEVVFYENHVFGFDPVNHKPTGLGADDKNGIWIALKCLEKFTNIKVAFFTGEEIGCVGSRNADMSFFDDCRFVLQCDRRNNCDFITNIMGTDLCGINFINEIPLKEFGYKTTSGLSTDVWALKENGLKVACCNMSCGYYNPHSAQECTDINALKKCLELVFWIISNMTDVYKHNFRKKKVVTAIAKVTAVRKDIRERYKEYYPNYDWDDFNFEL